MSTRMALLLAILVVAAGLSALAQNVVGRSAPGSLKATDSDSTEAATPGGWGSVAFDLEFSEPSGNEYLEAKETGRLRIAISNPGSTSAKGVYVKLNPLQEVRGISYPDSIYVGEIPVSSSRYAIFYFQAAERLDPQIVTFGVEVRGGGKALLADPKLLTFLTRQR